MVVGSTDSDAMRRAFLSTCHRSKSVRDMVRTSEAGVLREQGRVIDGYNEAEPRVRLTGGTPRSTWAEQGARLLRGDGTAGVGDLLFTGGGRPLLGDPYKQIGERVEAVKAQRLLQEDEDAPSPGDR